MGHSTIPLGHSSWVSTEAGGEGINLHEHCHVMVNYDLPWNPMRLVQRIGRLYRYGQKKRVVVFNIHQSDTADEQVLDTMYTRLEQVATDLAAIDDAEFNDALKDDILGELSDFMDIEDVLMQADSGRKAWSQERIDEALLAAREAVSKQGELFRHAAGFEPSEMRGQIDVRTEHLQSFVEGMCGILGIEIVERTNRDLIWQLRLSETVKTECGLARGLWRICFDRLLATRREGVLHVDMDCWLLRYMVERAQQPDFGGHVVMVDGAHGESVLAGIARWINGRGRRARMELLLLTSAEGEITINPEWVQTWLMHPRSCTELPLPEPTHARTTFGFAEQHAERFVVDRCSRNLQPDQPEWVSAAFIERRD
ncbi:MAG: helicase-related protein [Xanthomonadales bacterium]|nr:helicase-related protein [Xanthomonadales bacterium]